MKIKDVANEYLAECKLKGQSEQTLRLTKHKLKIFCNYCYDELGVTEIEEVDKRHVKALVSWSIDKGNKPCTTNSYIKIIQQMLVYAYKMGYTDYDTYNKRNRVETLREEKKVINTFAPKQIKELMETCSGNKFMDLRDKCILTFLFDTGMRASEVANIKNVDIRDGFIIVAAETAKFKRSRTVAITPHMEKAMIMYERAKDAYFEDIAIPDYYFIGQHNGKMTGAGIGQMMRRRAKETNIKGVRVSPHTCRHTWACRALKSGMSVYEIQRGLGHGDLDTTERYLRGLDNSDVIKAMRSKSTLMNLHID